MSGTSGHRAVRVLVAMLVVACASVAYAQRAIRVGCKNFTEQQILGEIIAQAIERTTDLRVDRRFGLGGTDICHAALLAGSIDIYPEYTGTGLVNVLRAERAESSAGTYLLVASAYRERYELEWLAPFGFNNTYAIAVRGEDAEANNWSTISDLAQAEGLRAGFTAEFMERPDGYPGLRDAYTLDFADARDLDPGLMYQALAQKQVDVICAFATDGRIAEYGLAVLRDDRAFFPPYDAAPVVRSRTLEEHPELRDALAVLAGVIDDDAMREMNFAVDVRGERPSDVASRFLDGLLGHASDAQESGAPRARRGFFALALDRREELARKLVEHLVLTALGTSIAIAIGIPLGIFVHRTPRLRPSVLALIEIVQTIPSLAMLAFLFALYGLLGTVPAVTALVLYALLPIVLNTFTGLAQVSPALIQAARGVGMSSAQRLRMVELPLAAPVIIAGVRAATVLTVGIATLSTYIGAGGLGDFIARGLARNDTRLTLLGAVPAAVLAVLLGLLIRLVERAATRR
ncbi:MAG: glycine betaine ABC transporter substrate-binding protein [Phycisphaerales bacterium]|jgi:osmoprotectant transport system permease protein|nr:glycine betaine ABC transporter substrate-binding protein [Phycisphaerales bacterium]